jgi:hypothetical protein
MGSVQVLPVALRQSPPHVIPPLPVSSVATSVTSDPLRYVATGQTTVPAGGWDPQFSGCPITPWLAGDTTVPLPTAEKALT